MRLSITKYRAVNIPPGKLNVPLQVQALPPKTRWNIWSKTILNIKPVKMFPDESDALAVAICHSLRAKTPAKGKKNWKAFIEAFPERIVNI